MQIVRKAHALQASEVETALNEGAKDFVQAWPKSQKGGVELGDAKGYDKEETKATKKSAPGSAETSKVGDFGGKRRRQTGGSENWAGWAF